MLCSLFRDSDKSSESDVTYSHENNIEIKNALNFLNSIKAYRDITAAPYTYVLISIYSLSKYDY